MRKLTTRACDPVEHLNAPERIAGYLDAALEDGDPAIVTAVVPSGVIVT
jgi:DNA-binding phage protein